MERTGALIERLLQQYHDNASAGKMLVTVQLLAAELQQLSANTNTGQKITVVMPRQFSTPAAEGTMAPGQTGKLEPVINNPPAAIQPAPATIIPLTVEEDKAPPAFTPTPQPPKVKQPWHFDPAKEVPTMVHQQKEKAELNEIIGDKGESLNEKLKASNTELGAMLQSSPVKDLKKAIGINDRYVFINELFRGDEVMYERSIKTINGFSNVAEAEFWIKRELKLKLAWHEGSETAVHFDQLVRRRFS